MNLRLDLFAKEIILFAATLVIGLVAAYKYSFVVTAMLVIQTPDFSLTQLIFLALVLTTFIFATRSNRWGKYVLWVFFILIIWTGSQVLADIFISSPVAIFAGLFVVTLFLAWRTVLMHDIAIGLALAGVGASIGLSITPTIGVIALIVLSFYDILAVYVTKHMVSMARGMIQSGAIFGFIIPHETKLFFTDSKISREQIGDRFMLLGSGDVGLPVVFIASLVRQSLYEAIIVAVFSLLGIFATHILFVNQKQRRAMAALPPIATACLIGYLVALLLKV